MMYILGYLRNIFYNINTLQFKSLGSVNIFLKKCLMLIKAVAYLFDKKLNIIPQNNILKNYCNLK